MVRRKPSRGTLVALALVALASTSEVAHAGDPLAEARERFAAGRKLEDAGRWAEALTVFQRVAEVRMTPQVRFHIALCMENVGLWTQAFDGFQRAAAEAAPGAPDVVHEANDHMRKLAASMPTVTLRVQGAARDDELTLDRRRVVIDEASLPIRADPGPHVAEVRRDGTVVARQYFALAPKATLRVELRVGEVAPEGSGQAAASANAGGAGSGSDAPKPGDGQVQRAVGWSAIGLGGASLVLMGVFIGLRAGAESRLSEACPGLKGCSPGVASIVSEGKRDAALVNAFGIVGGLAAAAGLVVVLTAPTPPARAAFQRIEIQANGLGITMRGAF